MTEDKEIDSPDIWVDNPDEFLLDNIKSFHYEVMDEGEHVWMAFHLENGRVGHLNIFTNSGKISTRYEEWNNEQT